ncbi:MAG: CRTAC1 family protein, partial [Candidatus Krumholzibacteriota bacterium]|nr:CRTAC1 family protein [Candidatus Krumholzibacteriota bacterium]
LDEPFVGGAGRMFLNRGDGTFQEVGQAAGVALFAGNGSGPLFADLDGDGWLDLFVGGVSGTPLFVLRNRGDGTFEDVTLASRITTANNTLSACAGDYDRDGDLDLLLTHWSDAAGRGHLWRNDGTGRFECVDVQAGITYFGDHLYDFSFTPNFADINNDGWLDVLIAGDFGTSQVYVNNGDGTFENVTTPVISDENGMGAAVGDYDNDGDLDWFVSSVWDTATVEDNWGSSGNRLYRNRGDGTFEDATDDAGVRIGYWGWGAAFADLNNDGHLDLFHVNGWQQRDANGVNFPEDPARLFVNDGSGHFDERSAELNANMTDLGRGVVCFDYDRDGDLDLFVANNSGPPILLRNDGGNALNYITVRLRGAPGNIEGIGARVYVTAAGATQMREIRAGSNYVSHDPAEAHFGIGRATRAEELRVEWPNGETTVLTDVAANQLVTLRAAAFQPPVARPPVPEFTVSVRPNPFAREATISVHLP